MKPPEQTGTRRDFFSRIADGLHGTALAYLLGNDVLRASSITTPRAYDLKPRAQHHPAKAKSIIHLFMNGGPSQVDLFDPKPALQKYAGQPPSRDLVNRVIEQFRAAGCQAR